MERAATHEQLLRSNPDVAGTQTMVNEAIRIAEALMWAVYGSDDAVRAGAVAGVLHTKGLDRLAS
jgi:hypothetical protein